MQPGLCLGLLPEHGVTLLPTCGHSQELELLLDAAVSPYRAASQLLPADHLGLAL